MVIVHDIESLQNKLLELAQSDKRIALVPTMGALHAGHLSLITAAKELSDTVVVSIFVNPSQFGKNEDFSIYPRTLEADIQIAETAGAEIIYAPAVEDMYQSDFSTSITAGKISTILCGKFRPGHFDGVATVVTKLLLRTMPHIAVFGMKDYQQLCVIDKVSRELDIPTVIIAAPTVREDDGLALSSRNRYLSEEERKIAPLLYKTLNQVAQDIQANPTPHMITDILSKATSYLTEQGFKVEYLELCDGDNLDSISELKENARLLVAAWLGKTRLIDNIEV